MKKKLEIIILILGIAFLFSCSNKKEITLIKKGEIIINFPLMDKKLIILYTFDGNKFYSIGNQKYLLELFLPILIDTKKKEYKYIAKPMEKGGDLILYGAYLSLFENDKIANIGFRNNELNIYDFDGNYIKGYIKPFSLSGMNSVQKKGDLIFCTLSRSLISINEKNGKINTIMEIDITEKQRKLHTFYQDKIVFTFTPKGTILALDTFEPHIYEYDVNGKLIYTYKDIPSHFVSCFDTPPFDRNKETFLSVDWSKKDYCSRFTISGSPSFFKNNYFIVPRRTSPPIYIDFYSYKKRKLIGSYNLGNRPFLGSDDKYLYVLNWKDKKRFVIEKYDLKFHKVKEKKRKITTEEITIKDRKLTQKYVIQDSVNTLRRLKKNYHISPPLLDMKNFIIKDIEEKEHNILEYINKDKKYHFLLFNVYSYTCEYYGFLGPVKEFCEKHTEYDYSLIFTKESKDEIKNSLNFFEIDEKMPIFNIDKEKILPLYPESLKEWYPKSIIILIDSEGNIIKRIKKMDEIFTFFDDLQK